MILIAMMNNFSLKIKQKYIKVLDEEKSFEGRIF